MVNQRTADFGRLSWKEIEGILPTNPVLLLPIGTVEQHGPHLPVNADNMVADFVARRTAEVSGAYLLPAINYGCSAIHRGFPGTISVRPETLAATVRDICAALIEQGFRRFVFFNNHGGNQPACEQAARDLKASHGVLIGNVYPWNVGYAVMGDQYADSSAVYGHGGEPETSAMLAMFPEDVRLDLAAARDPNRSGPFTLRRDNLIEVPGQTVGGSVFLDYRDLFPNGVSGDPAHASAALGKVWVQRVVDFAVAFVRHFDNVTAGARWAQRDGDAPVHPG